MRLRRQFAALSFLALTLALACKDGTGPSVGPPANLVRAAGDEQPGTAGAALPDSLVVRVTDARGTPVQGVRVTWEVSAGEGTLNSAANTTNTAGEARAAWTLGPRAGDNAATASVTRLSPVRFTATALAGSPAKLTKIAAAAPEATVGTPLSDSLAVRVLDAHDNPVPGVAVAWSVSAGGGSVSPGESHTDAAGVARTSWTLGTTVGENRVGAQIAGVAAESFVTRGTADAPAAMEKLAGDEQAGTTSDLLPEALAVRVLDRYGNVVPGVAVQWSLVWGGGHATPVDAVTDGGGVARARWEVGDSIGTHRLLARTGDVRAQFSATIEPTDPERAPPIQLSPPTTIGSVRFPIGNTPQGGQGQTVGGVSCIQTIAYHIHPHVSLFVEGEQIAIPTAIGITNPVMEDSSATGGDCFYWIHTHDATGLIHVEPPRTDIVLTLGQMFDVWGQPLASDNVAGFRGPVTTYIDGVRYRGDIRAIPFIDKREIAIYVGHRLAPLPTYLWPAGL
ncbi:hypothetical protein BH23GEM3_BH23GEM3_17800 [soil metagenome]